ncbi:hypothetical protein D3C86_2090000 [compost metagenome]
MSPLYPKTSLGQQLQREEAIFLLIVLVATTVLEDEGEVNTLYHKVSASVAVVAVAEVKCVKHDVAPL